MIGRRERLIYLAKKCQEKDVNPNKNTFFAVIIQDDCAKFLVSQKVAKEDGEILSCAYKADKWNNLLCDDHIVTSKNVTCDNGDAYEETGPLSLKVYESLGKCPSLLPKDICTMLSLDYDTYGHRVRTLRYRFFHKVSRKFGAGSNGSYFPDSQHNVAKSAYVPKSLNRKLFPEVTSAAIEAGWEPSKNTNRALIWKRDVRCLGRIEWWESGKVRAHLNPPQTYAKFERLLCNSFFESGLIANSDIFRLFAQSFRNAGATLVYDYPIRLPYRVIRTFEKSYGVVIKTGDDSHPNGLEIDWAIPEWAEKLEQFLGVNIVNLEKFTDVLKKITDDFVTNKPKALDPHDRSAIYG